MLSVLIIFFFSKNWVSVMSFVFLKSKKDNSVLPKVQEENWVSSLEITLTHQGLQQQFTRWVASLCILLGFLALSATGKLLWFGNCLTNQIA